jgi:hypothetical protein
MRLRRPSRSASVRPGVYDPLAQSLNLHGLLTDFFGADHARGTAPGSPFRVTRITSSEPFLVRSPNSTTTHTQLRRFRWRPRQAVHLSLRSALGTFTRATGSFGPIYAGARTRSEREVQLDSTSATSLRPIDDLSLPTETPDRPQTSGLPPGLFYRSSGRCHVTQNRLVFRPTSRSRWLTA